MVSDNIKIISIILVIVVGGLGAFSLLQASPTAKVTERPPPIYRVSKEPYELYKTLSKENLWW